MVVMVVVVGRVALMDTEVREAQVILVDSVLYILADLPGPSSCRSRYLWAEA